MSSSLWRQGVAVLNLSARPYDLTFMGHRPALLLAEAGFEVHTVSRGHAEERVDVDGVTAWVERNTVGAIRRVARLRAELLFVDDVTYGTLLGGCARRSWIRNPAPAADARLRRLQRAALRAFAATSFTNPAAMARWKLRARPSVELPYPVDVGWWSEPVPRRESWWTNRGWGVPEGPVFACVAAFARVKRHLELLDAIAPLMVANPDAVLVLAGHEDSEPDMPGLIRRRAELCGISEQVRIAGWISREEVRELFAWASLAIVNSSRETQCMAIYEALAAGVPTLISAVPDLTSQFPGLPAHGSDRELRSNVERLLGDPELGRAAIDSARERLAWADLGRHDELFHATVERLLERPLAFQSRES